MLSCKLKNHLYIIAYVFELYPENITFQMFTIVAYFLTLANLRRWNKCNIFRGLLFMFKGSFIYYYPLDLGRKLNVHKTFRRQPGHLLNVLCMFNLRLASRGYGICMTVPWRISISFRKCLHLNKKNVLPIGLKRVKKRKTRRFKRNSCWRCQNMNGICHFFNKVARKFLQRWNLLTVSALLQ